MRNLRNVPIQRKLRFVVLLTCSVALVVACGTLFALQFYFFRRDFAQDLATTAEIIGRNSTAAITFKDAEAGRQILTALKAKPHITGASIYLRDGRQLATVGHTHGFTPDNKLRETGLSYCGTYVLYTHTIFFGSERLGTLYLHADYRSSYVQLIRFYAGILVFVIATSFLVALLVSSRLERVILRPIRNLAETTRQIAANTDYSVRSDKLVDDELGSFTDSFNAMLDQIEIRDHALLHEIAERKRAEEELQKLHLQLVDASRQAGMAEVATGVLHNVGNVLNSVNVSATLIAERLGQSRTSNLVKATALLCGKNGSLADFLTQDPKGKLLPSYLADLSQHLDSERTGALTELQLLNKNIEHIKDIVSMQQSYARLADFSEHLPVDALVEDALSLNVGSLERHGVTVVRKYERVPPAAVDKHKVLQILVNIIRNAEQAMDDASAPEKRLTIGIRCKDGKAVEVSIADTGVGIAAKNLTRIFSHGFTTRAEGHGFGLHTAALAAQQMGGRLTAMSDGPGCGSIFVLELPIATALTTA